MKNIKYFIEAAMIVLLSLFLIFPSSAVFTDTEIDECNTIWTGKERVEINTVKTWSRDNYQLPSNLGSSNFQISGWTEGDNYRPSITQDSLGHVFITYQHDESFQVSSAGFSYNLNPTDQEAWFDNGVILSLSGIELLWYPDTARCDHPDYELMNVFVTLDSEEAGGMYIPDVTDYETWEIYTWTSGAPDPELAQISDGGWYQDSNYNDVIGPFNFYIYHEIYDVYDIESCPIFFHNGIDAASGVGYFDGQSFEVTAPGGDPDYVNLQDKIHTVIYNVDSEKIIWKKLVPIVDSDYEFTPYQMTVADGTNPSIAAYDDTVVIVFAHQGNIECVYSNNDGESWSNPVVLDSGSFPDVCEIGGEYVVAYVNNGNLYKISSSDDGVSWGTPVQINDVDNSVVAEENCVDIHAAGIVWVDNRNNVYDIYYAPLTSAPSIPSIEGPSSGKLRRNYDFSITSTDPTNLEIWYYIEWGDGSISDWLGPYASGSQITESHSWTEEGSYIIKVKAKNTNDIESGWAELEVSMPKNKPSKNQLITFLENHAHLSLLFERILMLL